MSITLFLTTLMQLSGGAIDPPVYDITVENRLTALSVRACFNPERVPTYLWARSDRAGEALTEASFAGQPVTPRRNRLSLRGGKSACFDYSVDLEPMSNEPGNRAVSRVGKDLLTNSGMWLWRPASAGDFIIRFHLPAGIAVSAPWQSMDVANKSVFKVTPAMADWSDYVAFGHFDIVPVNVPGSAFRLALLDGEPAANPEDVITWVRNAGAAAAGITGQFPLPSPQVLVVPIGQGSGPIPWAQVKRGGGSAAHFFINQEKAQSRFLTDWTPSHEFSHMLHPYLGDGGRWVSEGLASYYQNVGRARVRQLSGRQAWDRLHAGFERGRKASSRESLADMLGRGGGRHNYMRIYWSGAALALKIDVALRLRSGGKQTLDSVLGQFGACCLPSDRAWKPREFMQRLDSLAGGRVFETEYDAARTFRGFPDLDDTFEALALEERWGRLQYQRGPAAQVALRESIMAPRSAGSNSAGN